MSLTLALILIGAALLFSIFTLNASGPSRKQRQAAEQCETFLRKGTLALSCGNVDDAHLQYRQALTLARISQDAFQLSESLEGLARAFMKSGNYKAAVPLLEEALAHEPQWYTRKPNFAELIRNELEKAQALAAKQVD
jgi:Tfp pilus assembly protein PilF